jgi:Protein kinase domain/NPCBM/NEW2 domain/PASTA domain
MIMTDADPQSSPEPLGSRYLLDTAIGAGAMGQVWRSRTREGEAVAIKVLRPELSSDAGIVASFIQESQILTGLVDPHLVRIHDLVAEGSRLAIVMDLVEGPDLRTELARRGTFRPIDAAQIVDGVLAGLAVVHSGGVVHRDVKPENVLLGDGLPGAARLTDFGIARIVEESQTNRRTTVVGTPEYLAPEVADGAQPTPASDLYAVGVMLYELVAGVTPFSGGSPLAVLRRHAEQQPVRPEGMPEGIWQTVAALLAKDPAQRPSSAAEVRAQLSAAAPSFAADAALPKLDAPPAPVAVAQPTMMGLRAETQPVAAAEPPPAPPRRRGRTLLVALAAVLAIVVGAGVTTFLVLRPTDTAEAGVDAAGTSSSDAASSSSSRPTRATTSAPKTTGVVPPVTGLTLAAAQAALSNAGLRVAVDEILDENLADNTVTAQDPVEATELNRGETVTLTVARRPVGVFLSTLTAVEDSNWDTSAGATVTVNGTTYIHPVSTLTECGQPVSIQFDLGRSYRSFRTTVGLTDGSKAAGTVQFDVFVDGRAVATQTASLGAPMPIQVDVTGGLRLNITATRVESNCKDGWNDTRVYAVWADPTLFGLPDELPSPSAPATPTN